MNVKQSALTAFQRDSDKETRPVMDPFDAAEGEAFTSLQVCRLAACSYRMLDYWERIGAVRPARAARGSGSHRLWTARQVACVWVTARLAEMGCPARRRAAAFDALEANDSLWAGPLLVEHGRGRVRPVRSLADLSAGWVVDPRPAVDAVLAGVSVAA